MIELKSGRTVAVDCDETILNWTYPEGSKDLITICNDQNQCRQFQPHLHNINFLKSLKVQGYTIIVWSAGSGNWASKVVKALQLEEYVDLTCDKLEFAIDDLLDAKKIIKQVIWLDPISGEFKRNE
jgi:hypothetical protein